MNVGTGDVAGEFKKDDRAQRTTVDVKPIKDHNVRLKIT